MQAGADFGLEKVLRAPVVLLGRLYGEFLCINTQIQVHAEPERVHLPSGLPALSSTGIPCVPHDHHLPACHASCVPAQMSPCRGSGA
jgi:hypothetical protein